MGVCTSKHADIIVCDRDSQTSHKEENGVGEAEGENLQHEVCEHNDGMDISASPFSSSRSDILCGVSNVVYRKE